MNTKNFEKEHKSRRIINFVTNSTFTDVVQLNEYSKRLRINLYSLKLRKKVAQSYPFQGDYNDADFQALRSYTSPDAKLLIVEMYFTNTLQCGFQFLFKIDFPTANNPLRNYGVQFVEIINENVQNYVEKNTHYIKRLFFCAPVFLQKVNGVMYFVMMQAKNVKYCNKDYFDFDSQNIVPAEFNLYAFDGKYLVKSLEKSHKFNLNTHVNTVKSNSWIFENPFRNTHGWAEGWSNAVDTDQILHLNAEGLPCYLPKNSELNSHYSTSIFSFTNDWQICKFTFSVGQCDLQLKVQKFQDEIGCLILKF